MSAEAAGFAALGALLVLLVLGCPVGIAMLATGVAGFAAVIGPGPALTVLENAVLDVAGNYSFTLVPLFLLMGALAGRAGLSRDLFRAARRLTWRWRGGLAVAGITASAAFSAVCGSSLATASTMTRVAYPEMRAQGYDARLAAGSLAAGGTLGIMIPPSIALLLYALITEQSVGAMFLAGLVPGLLGWALYALAAAAAARHWLPAAAPVGPPPGTRGAALRQVAPVLALFGTVMGGLYGGLFTPTEAGGAGAGLALVLALVRRTPLRQIAAAFAETAALAGSIFVILIGAEAFGYLLSVSRIPEAMAEALRAAGWGPLELVVAIVAFYLVLGCFMESLAMILLTVPIFYPLVVEAGLDPVWFGIIAVVTVETGLITPPVGMNLFVVRTVAPELGSRELFVGILPFVAADLVRLTLLVAAPGLALALPRLWGY